MPIFRLAYVAIFLAALIAVFAFWSQVGGQDHLDLLPWHVKAALGLAGAFAVTKAAEGAATGERAWNARTLRWLGAVILTLALCGVAAYYAHTTLEREDQGPDEQNVAAISGMHSVWEPVAPGSAAIAKP
jgi:hypothetical protein